jgi:hypothetical protein
MLATLIEIGKHPINVTRVPPSYLEPNRLPTKDRQKRTDATSSKVECL